MEELHKKLLMVTTIDIGKAQKAYAGKIGVTTDELTDEQKKQVVIEFVLKEK